MDVAQGTTQPGVSQPVDTAAQFQSFFDAGAFDPNGKKPEPEQPSADVAAPESTAEPAPEAPEAPEASQEEVYDSLDALLRAKEIDPESARSLAVTVKIDGQEKSVPLAEVLKSYQLEGHVNNKSIELSNQQKAFEAERQAARQLMAQQLQQNNALGQLAQQQLTHDFQQVDWNGLRQSDPARYAALYADFQQRQGQIQNYLGQIQNQQAAAEQERQAELANRMQTEYQSMMGKHPEWQDKTVFAAAQSKMLDYAKSKGFNDAELNTIYDHRLLDVLHEAALYRDLQAAKPEALKKVRVAPQMAKPGTRTVTDPKQAERAAAIQRFNQNPKDLDAQAAVFSFLANNA